MTFAVSGMLFSSDPLNDPKFRADNDGIWHLRDNPAGPGISPDIFDAGILYSPQSWNLAAQCPFINYSSIFEGGDVLQTAGFSMGFGTGFSIGYDYQWRQIQSGADFSSLGLIARPFDFLSAGLTWDISNSSSIGIGLGLRPLFFIQGPSGSLITLTADAHSSSSNIVFENVGCRLSFNDSLSIRSWYDFEYGRAGLELSFAIGPCQTRLSGPAIPDFTDFRAGESIRIPREGTAPVSADITGRKILVINNIEEIYPVPQPAGLIRSLLNNKNGIDLPSLLDMIRRAAKDPSIAAIAFEDLPSAGLYASIQELAGALDEFRHAGKMVYFYADEYYFSSQYQILSPQADMIALNPSGSVNLTGISYQRLYFKDFLDKIGVRCVNLAPWETKSANNPFTYNEMPAGEREMLRRYLKDLSEQAQKNFSSGRAGRLKDSPPDIIASGPYMTSSKALDAGVVDSLMYRDEFEDAIIRSNAGAEIITSYPGPENISWGPSSVSKKVAVLYLNGPIITGPGIAGRSIGTSAVEQLHRLGRDPFISAILIRINSGGGVVITSDEIAREVKKTISSGKPVFVSMGDVAASGGYYASCFASRIFADPGTITGSIGVTGLLANFSGTLGKLGIHEDGIDLSKSSGFLNPGKEFRESDISNVHDMIISMYDRFVKVVAEGRKLPGERVRELGEGQVWTGREALANGLVDELGSLQDAENYIRNKIGGWVDFTGFTAGSPDDSEGLFGSLSRVVMTYTAGADSEVLSASLKPYVRAATELLSIGSGPVLYYDWMGLELN